jgi:lysophospholipase L1-like esterase
MTNGEVGKGENPDPRARARSGARAGGRRGVRGRPAVLAAVGLAVAAAVLALALDDRGGPVDGGSIVLIGDSLNVGVEPYLRELLEHWRIRSDDVVGRPTSEGLAALAAVHGATGPIVVSLGTNDDPGDPEAFRDEVERLLGRIGPTRCVIWATLWRDGAPETQLNAVLNEIARTRANVLLLGWASMLERHPEWVAPDATHGSPDGYRARAEEVVRLMRACPVAAQPAAAR